MACGYAEMNGMRFKKIFIYNAGILVTKAYNHASKDGLKTPNMDLKILFSVGEHRQQRQHALEDFINQREHSMPLCPLSRAQKGAVAIVAPHSNSIGHGVHATTAPKHLWGRMELIFVASEGWTPQLILPLSIKGQNYYSQNRERLKGF